MKLGIVTDSTCDLPKYLIEQHQIEVVPSILIIDGKEYADGEGISRDEFYKQLSSYQIYPTTAAPSIGDFHVPYKKLFENGCDHILAIVISEKLSATINAARQAAEEYPGKVTVVDSTSLTMGLGFQVLAAAEAAEEGLQAALTAIESTRKRGNVKAVLDTMENFKRSGRLPAAVTFFGGVLHIKPLVEVNDGRLKPFSAVRTTKQGNKRIEEFLLELGDLERLAILHTGAEQRAKDFLNTIMMTSSQSMPRDILVVNATTVIGVHSGGNALGFAAVKK